MGVRFHRRIVLAVSQLLVATISTIEQGITVKQQLRVHEDAGLRMNRKLSIVYCPLRYTMSYNDVIFRVARDSAIVSRVISYDCSCIGLQPPKLRVTNG